MSRLPVDKALRVLAALNARPVMSLSAVAEGAGLAPSTTVRLLKALCAAGYAQHLSRSAGYRVTAKALDLSAGVHAEERIVETAIEPMRSFTREHAWPLFIAVRDGLRMSVRYGTVGDSPYAVDPGVFDQPSPMLLGAVGRAYLAFCPERERREILTALKGSRRRSDAVAKDERAVSAVLRDTRRKGYAVTDPRLRAMTEPVAPKWRDTRRRVTGLAVPIQSGDRVLATLVVRYFPNAFSEAEAARRFLAPMQSLAAGIGARR
ncbi:MAG: helix-turn-helix domain-containing protein [Proteobacteria bacterium]|nr:helix-turn-helix domain-containing protein [Pseudomonadota bacterium]